MPSATFDTAFGSAHVAWTERGIRSFRLPGGELPAPEPGPMPEAIRRTLEKSRLHLAGTPQTFADAPLDFTDVSPFHAKVYRALREVPVGSTVSYIQLARRAGSPGASRAVGTAMAKNPWPLLVPCHRVLTERGTLGGFSAPGGVATKVRMLDLEGAGIDPLAQLTLADARLGKHIAAVGPCGLELKEPTSVFAALARSIVYQQLTGKAAATIFARVQALYPDGLRADYTSRLDDDALLGCGLSRNKLAALRDLGARAVAGDIPSLAEARTLPDEELIATLSRVRGIGRWSVEMFAMFSLGRPDILALGDFGLRKGFQKLFELPELATEAELAARGERWRPFRSIASWYLWRAAELP
ncbi:MAG: methylated-DNA--[protein]-cysteine S-methyltransferase [Proteobacteria bacterium]|nr:MAG: methylated-DNA--[protein]-cysteine S-methyltransferase [Pseudomonadota bacterium]